jgi:hypothetical protein
LYHICDFNLVFWHTTCHPPAGCPLLGGANVPGAAQVVGRQDTIEAQPSEGAAGGDRVPGPEVLPEGDTNVTVEEVVAGDPTGSTGLAGGASSSTIAVDNGATVESEVILEHPTLRAPGDVSHDEAMGTAHWALT